MVWAIKNVLTVLAVAINFFSLLGRAFTAITPIFSRSRHASVKSIAQIHRQYRSLTYYSLHFTVNLHTTHLVKTLRGYSIMNTRSPLRETNLFSYCHFTRSCI